ncbi:MAG: alpha-2-macroglobulin [Treponema sp.]|nr:alpha-2-macroglobulin [Treponema sp.]
MKKYALFLCAAALLASCAKKSAASESAEVSFSSSAAVPGKISADLVGYRIAYYDPSAVDDSEALIAENAEPFTITAFGPQDVLPAEIQKPAIYAAFSHSVVPLAKLGETFTEDAAFFAIEPKLAGVYRWYGAKLLAFEPSEFLPQQKYTVTASDALKSLGGKPLTGQRTFSFETERLSMLNWSLGDGSVWVNHYDAEPELARDISVVFSYPVDLDEIAKWLEIRNGSETFDFTLSYKEMEDSPYYYNRYGNLRDGQSALITMKKEPPLNAQMTVNLKAGARSKPGWLGAKQDSTFTFHTLKPFALTRAEARAYSVPRSREPVGVPIRLYFSYDVEEKGAEKYFAIEGFPPLTKENVSVYGSVVALTGLPLDYESRYIVTVSADLKDARGRTLGSESKSTVYTGLANSYVSIYDEGSRTMEAAYPPRYPWEVLNPSSIIKFIGKAESLYKPPVDSTLQKTEIDIQEIPRNKKFFFMEDLSPYLGPSGKGAAGLKWVYSEEDWNGRKIERKKSLVVQVTDIGITTRYAYNSVLVWATRLSTGAPISGADVTLFNRETPMLIGKTDAQGLAVFDFQDGEFIKKFPSQSGNGNYSSREQLRIKVVEKGGAANGGDEAEFIPNDSHNLWRFNIEGYAEPRTVEKARALVFLFTDRGLYKPGETVSFRGVDRTLSLGKFRAYTGPYTVEVQTDYSSDKPSIVLKGLTTKSGGSYGSFTVPEDANPGTYTIRYSRTEEDGDGLGSVSFTVANFEALRFEASLSAPSTPFYQGDSLSMRFTASYLGGGALANAPYRYHWTRENNWFQPRNGLQWEKWRFGPENSDNRSYVGGGEGVLGPDGTASIIQKTVGDAVEGAAYTYNLEVSAQDAARQEVASRASVTVHPAAFYIGARVDENGSGKIKVPSDVSDSAYSAWFLPVDKPAVLSWALVDPDGSLSRQRGPLSVQFIHYEWKQARQAGVGGRVNVSWERVEEVVQEHTVDASETPRGVVAFTPNKGGEWAARLKGKDARGRTAVTSVGFYASGGGWVRWGATDVDAIQFTPDKPVYSVGDVAKLMARSPLPKGKYLLTIEREGFFKKDSRKIIEMDGSSCVIEVPIEEDYAPIVYVALCGYSVRSGPPENVYYNLDLDKPHGVFGLVRLQVDVETRRYEVEIEPQKDVFAPGETAEARIKITNKGRPVPGAEIAFLAVDRGVVDLVDYHVPNPLEFFYAPWNFPHAVRGGDSRSLLLDPVLYSLTDLQGGDTRERADDGGKIDERSNWAPTAVFEPFLVADADGTVTVKFKLPDSLTTYRCTAIALGERDFGIGEENLRVSAALTATAALPRKLRWRDTGTVSLILTNLEKKTVEAKVSLEIENAENSEGESAARVLEVDGESAKTAAIPPGETREVQFSVAATGNGEAKLTWTLRSPSTTERIIKFLTVDRPSVYETVTSIGTLGARGMDGASIEKNFVEEGVVLPSLVPEGTGSLSVTLAASRLAQLKETVRYLLDYPYGCLEQRTAALAPLVAFGEYLDSFQLDSPVKNPKETIEKELAFIAKNQLADGTYPYWPGGTKGDVLVSLRVAHIATLAERKGYKVPSEINVQETLNAIPYLTGSLKGFFEDMKDPFLQGYWYYVKSFFGETGTTDGAPPPQEFFKKGDALGISGYAFAGLAADALGDKNTAAQALDRIKRFLRPGTRTVDLTDTYEQTSFWNGVSSRYALALMLFYAMEPSSDITTRLTQALLNRQRRGVWGDTASSYWAVLAFEVVAKRESKTSARVQASGALDGKTFLNAEWKSYGGLPVTASLTFVEPPLLEARRDVLLPLRIESEGAGDLYYTASLRYGIPAELASARDEGIGVFAETFDENGAVARVPLALGKTYTRRIVVSTSRDRTFLALNAPIPSGCEIVDATFVTSSTVPQTEDNDRASWNRPWGFQRFVMDNEVRFHWSYFNAGKEELTFRFRAVMPGVYPTPPVQAECMYEPEIFGRSSGELARIF